MRQAVILILKIAISLGLLYFAMRGMDLSDFWLRLKQANVSWFLAATVVVVIQVWLAALRWREFCAELDAPLSAGSAFRYSMIGMFFNQVLPGSVGGDVVRAWLLGSGATGWRAGAYSVLADRIVGTIVLIVIVAVSLPWSYQLINNADGRFALVVVVLAALAGSIGFLGLGFLRWTWLDRFFPIRHLHGCSVVSNRVILDPRRGPLVIGISVVIQILVAVTAWCVVRSIVAPAHFADLFLLTLPIMLITIVPVSIAGWGLREAVMTAAFGFAGLPTADGLAVSLLIGGAYFAVGIIGGVVWLASGRKIKAPTIADT